MTKHNTTKQNRKPNRLINEKSPYLLQHAYNLVNWFPWGDLFYSFINLLIFRLHTNRSYIPRIKIIHIEIISEYLDNLSEITFSPM
ncbi:thioredoxin domain-containing protein [Clostridium algoriphilum]|nr:DUF255 domain-containing protein [Clostridium algoriphilum]MCB2292385.1 thioredoxin domain-containing protein [Clostridium algoriphilum]